MNEDKIRQAFGFLRNTNPDLTDGQIAGIVGNLMQESGLNPGAVGDTNMATPSTGIAQWRESRLDNRLAYEASREGEQADAMLLQLGFLNEELTGKHKQDSGGLHDFFTANPGMGADDAAHYASKKFFRPHKNSAHNDQRAANAMRVMEVMGLDPYAGDMTYSDETVAMANNDQPEVPLTADTPEDAVQNMSDAGISLDMIGAGIKRLMGEGGASDEDLAMPERTIGDNLIALGVGISQLGSGQTVDISTVVARQNQRRMQEAQLQQQRAKQQQKAAAAQQGQSSEMQAAAALAKVAVDAGVLSPEVAMGLASGEKGRETLAEIAKQFGKTSITKDAPMNEATLRSLGASAVAEGLPPEVAQAIAEDENLARAYVNQQLDAKTPTAQVKTLQTLYAPGNEQLREAYERADMVRAGGLNKFYEAIGKGYRTSMERDSEQMAQADGMLRMSQEATERLRALPNNAESSQLTAYMAGMQPIIDDIAAAAGIEPIKLVGEDLEQMAQAMDAFVGQAFQTLRQPGSGHTSNMESKMFIQALPDMGSNVRTMRLRMAVLRKQAEIAIKGAQYRDEYRANLLESGDPGLNYSQGDMNNYSRDKLKENGEDAIFKTVDQSALPRFPAGTSKREASAQVYQYLVDQGIGRDDPIMIRVGGDENVLFYTLADFDPNNMVEE